MAIYENEFFDGNSILPSETKEGIKALEPKIRELRGLFFEVFPWTTTLADQADFEFYFAYQLLGYENDEVDDDYDILFKDSEKISQEKVDILVASYREHLEGWGNMIKQLRWSENQTEEVFEDIWPEIASTIMGAYERTQVDTGKTFAEIDVRYADPYRFVHCIAPALLVNGFEMIVRSQNETRYADAIFIREIKQGNNLAISEVENILARNPLS